MKQWNLKNRIKERSINERQDNFKWPNTCELGVPEGKVSDETGDTKLFLELMETFF